MFFKKKITGDLKLRREMAEKLHGMHIKYVMERFSDGEDDIIIGREGALLTRGKEFLVFSSQHDVFRSVIDDTDFAELMSLGGAIITGYDILSGKERTIIAYYTDNA